MQFPAYYAASFGAILGAILGSFFSATVWAWLNEEKNPLLHSICGRCRHQLSPLTLIPIFSYIFLGGKCHYCGCPIPRFHFLLELLAAALGALIFYLYGISWLSLCYAILAIALTAASAADCLILRLPDFITLGSFALLPPVLLLNQNLSAQASLAGCLLAGGIPLLLRLAFKYLRHKEALGMGDVKLFALAGAFLGPLALPPFFLLAACGGIAALLLIPLFSHAQIRSCRLPFGPFISASFLLFLLFPSLVPSFYAILSPAP